MSVAPSPDCAPSFAVCAKVGAAMAMLKPRTEAAAAQLLPSIAARTPAVMLLRAEAGLSMEWLTCVPPMKLIQSLLQPTGFRDPLASNRFSMPLPHRKPCTNEIVFISAVTYSRTEGSSRHVGAARHMKWRSKFFGTRWVSVMPRMGQDACPLSHGRRQKSKSLIPWTPLAYR
jgi:hypothetical protein